MASGHTGNVVESMAKDCNREQRAENAQRVDAASPSFGDAVDARLALIVDRWKALPEAIKAGIVAMVKSVTDHDSAGSR